MHPTITNIIDVVATREADKIAPLPADDVTFMPPTYSNTLHALAPLSAGLGPVR